jgi:hypothetical protein
MSDFEAMGGEIVSAAAQQAVLQGSLEGVPGLSGCMAVDIPRIVMPGEYADGIDLTGKLPVSPEPVTFESFCASSGCGAIGRLCVVNGAVTAGDRQGPCVRRQQQS